MAAQGSHQTEKRLCVGLLAHVDAGKTTLSEAMLYQAGVIRAFGRVDHGDTFLDTDAQERSRGITIFSKQAVLPLPGCTLTLLDTPGHVDFSAEMERTLQVLDCAVLVVSGTAGVQGHTATLWQLLRRYQVPAVVFVNKMDIGTADHEDHGRIRTRGLRRLRSRNRSFRKNCPSVTMRCSTNISPPAGSRTRRSRSPSRTGRCFRASSVPP